MATLWCTALRACFSAFERLGLDNRRIREAAGIDDEVLADPDARVPFDRAGRIWPAAQEQWRKPGLGLHAGAALPDGSYGLLEFVFASSATVRNGLASVARAFGFVSGGQTTMEYLEKDAGYLVYGGMMPEQVRDYALTGMTRLIARYGTSPSRVGFAGPALEEVATYRELLGCDVSFEQARNQIVVGPAALETPLPIRYQTLRHVLDREVDRLHEAVERDLVDDVRGTIALLLRDGTPRLDDVARRMALSRRTLQRRLEERGRSLRELIEDVRRELGIRYVKNGELGVGEIAHLLGYADPPTFTHAFKRWTGMSPSQARRGNRA
jgi:AraC-like DNA-binding protein